MKDQAPFKCSLIGLVEILRITTIDYAGSERYRIRPLRCFPHRATTNLAAPGNGRPGAPVRHLPARGFIKPVVTGHRSLGTSEVVTIEERHVKMNIQVKPAFLARRGRNAGRGTTEALNQRDRSVCAMGDPCILLIDLQFIYHCIDN
jgi:hypothetical protein